MFDTVICSERTLSKGRKSTQKTPVASNLQNWYLNKNIWKWVKYSCNFFSGKMVTSFTHPTQHCWGIIIICLFAWQWSQGWLVWHGVITGGDPYRPVHYPYLSPLGAPAVPLLPPTELARLSLGLLGSPPPPPCKPLPLTPAFLNGGSPAAGSTASSGGQPRPFTIESLIGRSAEASSSPPPVVSSAFDSAFTPLAQTAGWARWAPVRSSV